MRDRDPDSEQEPYVPGLHRKYSSHGRRNELRGRNSGGVYR